MLVLKEPYIDDNEYVQGYSIDADDFNIILYKLYIVKDGKNKGVVNRTALSFCTSIESVLHRVYQLEVGLVGLSDLEALNQRITSTIDMCVSNLGKLNYIRGNLKGL